MDTAKVLLRQYGVAVGACLFALLLAMVTATWNDRAVFMLFIGAVVVCAYFGGIRPGALATGVTALCLIAQFLFLPADSPRRNAFDFVSGLLLYVVVGMLVSYLGWECRRALAEVGKWRRGETELSQQLADATQRFRDRESQLSAQLGERQRNEEKLRKERDELQAEWEAADEKLLKELNELRQKNQQSQKQLSERQQTEDKLRKQLADAEDSLRRQLAEAEAERTRHEQALKEQLNELETEVQLLRDEQVAHESQLKLSEAKVREKVAEFEKSKRKVEEELLRQRDVEKALRMEMEQLGAKHTHELSEWEQALQDAETDREALAQKLAATEAAVSNHDDEIKDRMEELGRASRAAEDRFDALVDRLHQAAAPPYSGPRQARFDDLVRLVERFWVLNRLKRGNLSFNMQPVELDVLIDRVVRTTANAFEAKGQHLTVSLPLETHWLWADAVRLQQAFIELLAGISKRGKAGARIELAAECRGDNIHLKATDHDTDTSADEVARFTELRAGPDVFAHCHSDGELGLAMARTVIELHGGEFALRRRNPEVGMEMVFHVPVLPREAADESQPKEDTREVSTGIVESDGALTETHRSESGG